MVRRFFDKYTLHEKVINFCFSINPCLKYISIRHSQLTRNNLQCRYFASCKSWSRHHAHINALTISNINQENESACIDHEPPRP